MPPPWRNSYNCTITTHNAWLPGDSRGWRSRHHREHVECDYHNPPPTDRDSALLRSALQSSAQPAIVIPVELRAFVLDTFLGALLHHHAHVEALCVGGQHLHVLAQFPATGVAGLSAEHQRADGLNPIPRYILGKAMSWTTRTLKKHLRAQSPPSQSPPTPQSPPSPDGGTTPPAYPAGLQPLHTATLWAARPSIKPIADESHFHNARNYILAHKTQRAAIWPQK